jgi:catechol 2,3-dioxygenase-like lactoylglutathione lyase family enzyme
VQDLDRTYAFYAGCFALSLAERQDDFVVLRSDDWDLTLVAIPDEIMRLNPLGDPPPRREHMPVKLGFSVTSIASTRPLLARWGGRSDDPSQEWDFQDTRRCDAIDPEGNVIQLIEAFAAF